MKKAWTFVAALAVAAGAHAQTKKELVAKVLQLQQPTIEAVSRGIVTQVSAQVIQGMRLPVMRAPEDKRDALAKQVQTDVRMFYDEVEPLLRKRAVELAPSTIGAGLEERFSEDELKQLIAMLESPVAKKFHVVAPQLQNDLVQKLLADAKPIVDPKLKALNETLRKRLTAAMPPASAASGAKK